MLDNKTGKGRKLLLQGGEVFPTNSCGDIKVVGHSAEGYEILFLETGNKREGVSLYKIKNGRILDSDLMRLPRGFKHGIPLRIQKEYDSIHARCDPANTSNRQRRYEGCFVHEDFSTVVKYARWRDEQKFADSVDYLGRKYNVDKDILVYGNKCYGPETCVFVPQQINGFFSFVQSQNNNYIGVLRDKTSGKYYVNMSKWPGGKVRFTGFLTEEAAFDKYCLEKESHSKFLAGHFLKQVDACVTEALLSFDTRKYIEAQRRAEQNIIFQ